MSATSFGCGVSRGTWRMRGSALLQKGAIDAERRCERGSSSLATPPKRLESVDALCWGGRGDLPSNRCCACDQWGSERDVRWASAREVRPSWRGAVPVEVSGIRQCEGGNWQDHHSRNADLSADRQLSGAGSCRKAGGHCSARGHRPSCEGVRQLLQQGLRPLWSPCESR